MANKARPIDYKAVKRMAAIGCTDGEIASVIGITPEWICKRKKKDNALREAIELGRNAGKKTLRRWQWNAAKSGNPTMLIWLGKQMLEQRDRHDVTGKDGAPLLSGLSDSDLAMKAKEAIGVLVAVGK